MEAEREVVECIETWEARAAELFTVCDRECKGFITKRDLQHLWGELPLDPDELESVFDSLDRDQNGFLSLQEFTDGFGSHLGLVIEFRADSSSTGSEGEQFLEAGEVGGTEGGSEECQLDGILALLASQDLDSNSAVVETVWQQIQGSGASMERLVAALLQELSRVKLEHGHLEAALATKTEQFNQQVSRLYEELESQISGEQAKAAKEQRQKGARVLATLEEEVAERDAALRALEEEQQGLRQRLEQAAAGEVAARQDNIRLEQHLKRVEEDLMRREMEVDELMQALDIHRRNTKNEKRRRAQQAFKVTEGIARERESLVTQLDLLRTINTQLRDEQDQIMPWSLRARDKVDLAGGGEEDYYCSQSPPPPDLRGVACTSPPPRPPISLPLTITTSSFHGSGGTASDYEHDDDYFSDTKVEVQQDSPSPSSPGEVSILQEILSQPALCVECGGALPAPPEENSALGSSTARPLLLCRQESFTQTSPTAETSPRSIETLVNSSDDSGDQETKQPKFVDASCDTEPPKLCICHGRVRTTTPSPQQWYSTSLVIFQPLHTPTTQSKPHHTTTHLHMVHHTQHTHHTHHTFHTSFTYFLPDISATTTRHTKSTQSTEHHTPPQNTTALQTETPQQVIRPEQDLKHHQNTTLRKFSNPKRHTAPLHPTIPEEPIASQHTVTQHHSTSQKITLHLRGTQKHSNSRNHNDTQEHRRTLKKHSNTQEKHSETQKQHINTQEKHTNTQEKHSNTQEKHSETQEKHSETQKKHSNIQEKHSNTQEKHSETQKKHSNTQEKHSDTQQHTNTQQHNNIQQHSDAEQHSNTEHFLDAYEQHTAQHSNTEEQHSDAEQYMDTQEKHTEQHSNTNQHNNTEQHRQTQQENSSSPQQQTQVHQHTDPPQEHNNTQHNTQRDTPSQQNDAEQHKEKQDNTKQHHSNTHESATQDNTNQTEQTNHNSHLQHISNTTEPSLISNQRTPTNSNTETTETGDEVHDEGAEEDTETPDRTQDNLQKDNKKPEAVTSSSSRQRKASDSSGIVTSLPDSRSSTVRRNTPTLVVTPLRRHHPLEPTQENHTREDEEDQEDGEKDQASALQPSLSPGVDDLYCPTRMFKVVFIGDSGVGKTTFIHRASTGEYRRDFGSTVGVDYYTVEVRVQGVVAVLRLWDTAGQERFRSITRQYYRNADCVVVMYDLTNEDTFLDVMDWISSVREVGSEGVMVAVVGNKEDLEDQRKVGLNEANRLAKSHNCYVCECSAARGSSVQEVLNDITSLLLSGNSLQGSQPPVIQLNQPPRPSRTCCGS